jgi:hypothetical protein
MDVVFGVKVLVNNLIGLSRSHEELLVLIAPCHWEDARVVHVSVALKLVQSLEHHFAMLGTHSRKSIKEELLDCA